MTLDTGLFAQKRLRDRGSPPKIEPGSAGVPGYDVVSWHAVFGPAGLPPAIAQRLFTEIAAILKQPDVISQFARLGIDPVGLSPDKLTAFQAAEISKWARVIKAAKIQPE